MTNVIYRKKRGVLHLLYSYRNVVLSIKPLNSQICDINYSDRNRG